MMAMSSFGSAQKGLQEQIKNLQRSDPQGKEQWIAYCKMFGEGKCDPSKHDDEFIGHFLSQYNSGARLDAPSAEEQGLKEQIKAMQRSDPAGKEQWIAYCDAFGAGKCDPNKHDDAFISSFLTQYSSGARLESGGEVLVQATKFLQKKSQSFRNAWAQFCMVHGGGKNDPAKQPPEIHIQFYDGICAGSGGGMAMMGGGMGMDGPATKKTKLSASPMGSPYGGMGGMMGFDARKAQLVDQVKSFQKQGDAQKEAWWSHCDQMLGGVRDPARHDTEVLQEFVTAYGVGPASSGTSSPMAGGGVGGVQFSMAADPQKQELINRIKSYQKADPSQKEAWDEFCNSIGDMKHTKNPTKDPSRHEVGTLMDFINRYGVP